jgi:hypothetical protein
LNYRPALPRTRTIAASALIVGACVPNPFYEKPPSVTGTTTTETSASSTGAADTTVTSAATTLDEETAGEETTGEEETTTGIESTTGPVTTTDGACLGGLDSIPVPIASDAFFVNTTGADCFLQGAENPNYGCPDLNFGATEALRLIEEPGVQSTTYALIPDLAELAGLAGDSPEIAEVSLKVTVDGYIDEPTKIRVGVIGDADKWIAGSQHALPPEGDEASYSYRANAMLLPWSGGDGPRGASFELCSLELAAGMYDHVQIHLCDVELAGVFESWLTGSAKNHGLVLSTEAPSEGLYVKSIDAAQAYHPVFEAFYCPP